MSTSAKIAPELLSEFEAGHRFGLWIVPADGIAPVGAVLFVQPFLDELPLSRRVIVTLAHRLANDGWTGLILDLHGTGDSAGDRGDAALARWRDDLSKAVDLLRARAPTGPLVLLGVRMGALLATDTTSRLPLPPDGLVLWNPPERGGALIEPLQKLARMALIARDPAPVSDHASGPGPAVLASAPVSIEPKQASASLLAGYRVYPDLIGSLSALRLDQPSARHAASPGRVYTLNVQRMVRPEQAAPKAVLDACEAWRHAGWTTESGLVIGEPFWASMEPTQCEMLIDRTRDAFAALAGGWRATTNGAASPAATAIRPVIPSAALFRDGHALLEPSCARQPGRTGRHVHASRGSASRQHARHRRSTTNAGRVSPHVRRTVRRHGGQGNPNAPIRCWRLGR